MSIDVHVAASERRSKKSKVRFVEATLVAWVEADKLWTYGEADNKRPVWALFFVRSGEAGAFVSALQAGRKVETPERRRPETWEFLRSAGYEYVQQRYPEGVTVNAFLPELFTLTPGLLDAKLVRFVILPPTAWLDEAANQEELEAQIAHVRRAVNLHSRDDIDIKYACRLAGLFLHRLNARTRAPLISDPQFAAQILIAALNQDIATMAGREGRRWDGQHEYKENYIDDAKLSPGVSVNTTHEEIEKFLAEQVAIFDQTREVPAPPRMLKVAPVAVLRKQRRDS